MFVYLLLLFTVVPLVELALLMWVGQQVGWLTTLVVVIGTGMLGAALARWQGLLTAWRIRGQLAEKKIPTDALLDGLLILIAGVVLITPGILTDLTGFALLMPSVRRRIKEPVKRWLQQHVELQAARFTSSFRQENADQVIDVQIVSPEHKTTTTQQHDE